MQRLEEHCIWIRGENIIIYKCLLNINNVQFCIKDAWFWNEQITL